MHPTIGFLLAILSLTLACGSVQAQGSCSNCAQAAGSGASRWGPRLYTHVFRNTCSRSVRFHSSGATTRNARTVSAGGAAAFDCERQPGGICAVAITSTCDGLDPRQSLNRPVPRDRRVRSDTNESGRGRGSSRSSPDTVGNKACVDAAYAEVRRCSNACYSRYNARPGSPSFNHDHALEMACADRCTDVQLAAGAACNRKYIGYVYPSSR